MPSKKKALVVAKDVLAQLKAKTTKYKVSNGYLGGRIDPNLIDLEKPLQPQIDVIQSKSSKCEACALGGCFLSYVRLFNNVETKDVVESYAWNDYLELNSDNGIINDSLSAVFSPLQMALIELAFESPPKKNVRSWFGYGFTMYLEKYLGIVDSAGWFQGVPEPAKQIGEKWELVKNTVAFSKRYRSPVKRVEAIMKNIVRNEGVFVPPQRKKKELI